MSKKLKTKKQDLKEYKKIVKMINRAQKKATEYISKNFNQKQDYEIAV